MKIGLRSRTKRRESSEKCKKNAEEVSKGENRKIKILNSIKSDWEI